MSTRHRHQRCASRRLSSFAIEYDGAASQVWLPDPDDPPLLASFGDAAALAVSMLDLGALTEVLVLLDHERRVVSMLIDPPAEVVFAIGWLDGPGLEVPFTQTLVVQVVPVVRSEAPSATDALHFRRLRSTHVLQGLELLDVIRVDHDRVQSLAIALDPDCAWFRGPDPAEPAPASA